MKLVLPKPTQKKLEDERLLISILPGALLRTNFIEFRIQILIINRKRIHGDRLHDVLSITQNWSSPAARLPTDRKTLQGMSVLRLRFEIANDENIPQSASVGRYPGLSPFLSLKTSDWALFRFIGFVKIAVITQQPIKVNR